jgi:hypothetical protein
MKGRVRPAFLIYCSIFFLNVYRLKHLLLASFLDKIKTWHQAVLLLPEYAFIFAAVG